MAKYTIEIPEELHKYMVEGNWDVQAYIKQVLIDPLVKRFESEKKNAILSQQIKEVEDTVKDVKMKMEIKDFEEEKAEIEIAVREKVEQENIKKDENDKIEADKIVEDVVDEVGNLSDIEVVESETPPAIKETTQTKIK